MWFVIATLFVLAGPAQAQTRTFYGAGVLGCGEVIARFDGEKLARAQRGQQQGAITILYMQLENHLLGMMSGANWAATREVFPPRDLPSRMLFLEQHCRSNPLDDFHRAIIALAAAERRR